MKRSPTGAFILNLKSCGNVLQEALSEIKYTRSDFSMRPSKLLFQPSPHYRCTTFPSSIPKSGNRDEPQKPIDNYKRLQISNQTTNPPVRICYVAPTFPASSEDPSTYFSADKHTIAASRGAVRSSRGETTEPEVNDPGMHGVQRRAGDGPW